jgi:DNA-binding transcriptional LysR family regulator
MLSEHVTVETGDTKLSRRFSSAVQVTLRSLEKGEAKKYQNYINEVITVRTGHPLTRGRMTKERLLEFPHVVVEPARTMESVTDGFPDKERNGKRVSVERALYEFQYGRIGPGGRAVVCVPSFATVAPFLQSSDMVAMLPRRLALWAATHAPLSLLDPPYRSITIEIEMLWVEGADEDEGLQWLLNELAESIEDLE